MTALSGIRAALQAALAGMTPALATASENTAYTPVVDTPYQRVNLLWNTPDNSEIGPNYVQPGLFVVTLVYPINTGPTAAAARAQLLRDTFKRGFSFVSGGTVVTIDKTPELRPAQIDGDRYSLPVRIPFTASITA